MEGNNGCFNDKTRVLDIKPLRTLRPVFPSGNQAPPFVCAPPFGPFPPGFSPFYPFSAAQSSQQAPELNQSQPQYTPQHQPLNLPQQPQYAPQHQPQNPPQQPQYAPQHQPQNPPQQPQYAPQHQPQNPPQQPQYAPQHQPQNPPQQPQYAPQHQPQNPPQQPQYAPQHQPQNPPQQPQYAPQHQPQNPPQQPQYAPQHQPQNPPQQPQNALQHQPQNPPQHQPQNPPQQPQYTPQHQPQNPQQYQPETALNTSVVTPVNSFGTPDTSNGDVEPEGSSVKRKRPKRVRPVNVNFESGISVAGKENGYRELVMDILMRFDAVRRRFAQLEDAKEPSSGIIKRPDLKAGANCMSGGVRTNSKKRLGIVHGVEIGDIYFFRFEMCLVGLHSPSMAGIDYLVVKGETEEVPIATSIVSSGLYDNNDAANPEVLIYTGQGGNAEKDKQSTNQKLERGNLALENSMKRNSAVRVIRGLRDNSHCVKIYVYDGLYDIQESWVEKGKAGQDTFKYKLVRALGQPPAFATWTAVKKWKAGLPSRQGLLLPDITRGVESIAVSLVNEVDAETGPAYFTYSPTVKYSESFRLMQPSLGCDCGNLCKPGNLNCHCIRKNGGDFPYTNNGVLISRKPMIYECSPSCPCTACKSKVTQMGLKVRLEVFKTANRGWGLRSWEPIRAGSFICIYAGEAKDKSKVQQTMANDDYTFDTTRVSTPFKWNYEHGLAKEDGNYEPGLAKEDASVEISEEPEIPLPLIISAKNIGNVARFMNHSCSPNVFWQPVSYESNNQLTLHVAFFAISHIPPMTELTYDYGVSRPSGTQNGNPLYGKKKCFCGSEYCRGLFG